MSTSLHDHLRSWRKRFLHNLIIDNLVTPVSYDEIASVQGVGLGRLDMSGDEYQKWVQRFFPAWRRRFGHLQHKKLIELFATHTLLDPQTDDVFMDAAGGGNTYLVNLSCSKRYLQDLSISQELRSHLGNGIEYVESDAGDIPLPASSIDKVSCHHSFEHCRRIRTRCSYWRCSVC